MKGKVAGKKVLRCLRRRCLGFERRQLGSWGCTIFTWINLWSLGKFGGPRNGFDKISTEGAKHLKKSVSLEVPSRQPLSQGARTNVSLLIVVGCSLEMWSQQSGRQHAPFMVPVVGRGLESQQ